MCKRHTNDPLVRLFLDRWRLNPLAVPREHAQPGQLWLKRGRQVSGPLELSPLLRAPVVLPEPKRERLGDMEATSSHGYDVKVGLGLLEAFLTAIGAAGVVDKLRAGYEQRRTSTIELRFTDVTLRSIDPGILGRALAGARFDESHPLADPANQRFVAAAVARTPSVAIRARDERHHAVEMDAGLLAAVNANAAVDTTVGEDGEINYHGAIDLAIGVELYELHARADGSLSMGLPGSAAFRAGRPAPPPAPAFLGDEDEALIVPVEPD